MAQRLHDALATDETAGRTPTDSASTVQSDQLSVGSTTPLIPSAPSTDSTHRAAENQIQTQHLATLLLQAASHLSTSSAQQQHSAGTHAVQAPVTPVPSVLPQPRQDDQLSEASGTPPTPICVNPDPAATLPPVPARLHDRIIAGEFIDLNNLLTKAMFSTRDGPLHQQTPTRSLTLQMSTQTGEFEIAQTPTASRKINSFALWMEAWNVYASTLLSSNPSHALELFG